MTASSTLDRSRLLTLFAALALLVTACGSAADVETDATGEEADTTEQVDADGTTTTAEVSDGDDGDDAEADAGGETDAMGEDEPMDDTAGDDATTTVTTAAPATNSGIDDAELAAAFAASTGDRFSLPFMYITADQDCEGCAPTISLYYVPSEAKPSILTLQTAYIDGVAQADFAAVDPTLSSIDPRRVAELLGASDGATYGIDPVSGAVTSWTVDGNSVTLRCLQVDTRPVDLRTELCENSIIG